MKSNDNSLRKKRKPKKKKSQSGHIYNNSNIEPSSGKRIDLEKIKEINNGRRPLCGKREKPKKIPFSWDKIDKRGRPSITFNPGPEERDRMIDILNLTMRSPVKKELVRKLGKEFGRAYERYRRALERDDGKRACFFISESSMKHARLGGERCIRKCVTPFEVLRYWHEHISDFKDGSIRIPPLTWISSEQAIETVACSDREHEKEKPVFGNSFVNGGRFDPSIRKILISGGFDVSCLEENYLLQIQNTAFALYSGASFFISGGIRPMVKYLVKNYFKKRELNENVRRSRRT